MNVLFFLTPKCECACVNETDTLRQTFEKMEHVSFASVPLIAADGSYAGTLTEGDLLWNLKNRYGFDFDLKEAERTPVTDIVRKRDYMPVSVRADLKDVVKLALSQNFIPVQDDDMKFIGIIRRADILKYFVERSDAYNVRPDQ